MKITIKTGTIAKKRNMVIERIVKIMQRPIMMTIRPHTSDMSEVLPLAHSCSHRFSQSCSDKLFWCNGFPHFLQ